MNTEHIGVLIARLRKEKGMTQQELAEQLGITDKAVSKWERNLSCPDIAILPQVAEILGVTVDDLLSTPKRSIGLSPLKISTNFTRKQYIFQSYCFDLTC